MASSEAFPRGRTSIVAAAKFGIGLTPGYSSIDMAVHASLDALGQVGLTPADVDGLFIALPDDFMSGLSLAEYFGIQPRVMDNNRIGGSSFQSHVMWAALALEHGLCDVALLAYGSNQRSGAGGLVSAMKQPYYESPYKLARPAGAYALATNRYKHVYGLEAEQLGAVAIAARQWAMQNPEAMLRDPLTMEDYLASRLVADPLRVRDCCLITDGAAAIVMTRADRARDLVTRPAHILGAAFETDHRDITSMPDLTVTSAVRAGQRAYAQAGVGPKDIDVVELYDAFTINTILFLEDLGFCAKGEGAAFVASGAISPGGALPVNTNGGGLSCVHPGMNGMFTIVEAVEQVMGRCGERQIDDTQLALAHGNGGELSSQAVVILGSDQTL